ncbi:MAG: sigma-70 family RNA polymerase sigma factor [Lachnospiraceae bacterium]|nr:sigma-70 family RNA polymerase sigma factor [Lachnospiraceae bacterium]
MKAFKETKQMNKEQVEQVITAYAKPIYGFALKRCVSLQDAEDLAQEIVLKVFKALSVRDDIESMDKFIWTVAHNTLSNYYRDKEKCVFGNPVEELTGMVASDTNVLYDIVEAEDRKQLHREIARLSKLQRQIVIGYYYNGKKQEEIARELEIPVGTVKWHLFEAKKDLKKGMEIMRNYDELKFNPITFSICGTNGSCGTKGANSNFFRSALSQNIAYVTWKEEKTVNEIADILGVSPVYVESEAEYLEEYGFLTKKQDKYLCNILLSEDDEETVRLHDEMYQKAAKLFANELYDTLIKENVFEWQGEEMCQSEEDKNYILWALIPYIAAQSGEHLMEHTISFEQASTIRPDGGQNICYATVRNTEVKEPMYAQSMKNWCGPCWNASEAFTLWQIDSEWSERRVDDYYEIHARRVLSLLLAAKENRLSPEEYSYLEAMGIVKKSKNAGEGFSVSLRPLYIKNKEIQKRLLSLGSTIKEKYQKEFAAWKEPYVKAVLAQTPKHLHTMRKFGLQYIYHADGWFVLHCLKELVANGKLKLPTEEQKKALSTIIIDNK